MTDAFASLAAIAVEIEKWKAVGAKKRQERGVNQYTPERVKENLPEPSGKQASDEAGAMLGVSGRSVRDAKKRQLSTLKQNQDETVREKLPQRSDPKASDEAGAERFRKNFRKLPRTARVSRQNRRVNLTPLRLSPAQTVRRTPVRSV